MATTEQVPFRLLVPTTGASAPNLLPLAGAIASATGGEATVLSIVEVAPERSLSEGALVVRRRRNLLRKLAQTYPAHEFKAAAHTAHTLAGGIRDAARDGDADLLLLDWRPGMRGASGDAIADLVDDPPCDLAMVKRDSTAVIRSVLLPIRGGPHAQLALRLAQALAERCDAVLTLLHVDIRLWSDRRRAIEERYFQAVSGQVSYRRTEQVRVEAESVDAVLLAHGARHDLVIMGAAARDQASPALLGRIPELMARRLQNSLIVVKTREPVTLGTFAAEKTGQSTEARDISAIVDRWFAENTFHSYEFRSIPYLIDLKERQGRTISVVLPTLNEEATVGKILQTVKRNLVDRYPLIDELVVIDSQSEDRTVEIATLLGVPIFQHTDILPQYGSHRGKGEALWKSLAVTTGDIVVWIDSDITGFHPKFVYGLIGPLLTQPQLGFVKGFYRRPLNLGGLRLTTGGGRVTELTARPLFNLFYPELSGLVQPLAGEMAGRRSVLEAIPFFTGYGVETGLLIDILEQFGLAAIAQADLEERVHRNQSLFSLSNMAFAIVQVVMQRLGDRQRLQLLEQINTSMKLIHYSPTELFLEVKEIRESERPPIKSLPEYVSHAAGPVNGLLRRVAAETSQRQ